MRIEDQQLDIADVRRFVAAALADDREPLGAAVALAQASVSLIAGSTIGERIALAHTMMEIASELLDGKRRVN